MQLLRSIASGVGQIWARGCLGKGAVIFAALLVLGMCSSLLGGNRTPPATSPQPTIAAVPVAPATTAPEPTAAPVPTPEVLAQVATDAPTAEPATRAPEPTELPTIAPAAATRAPALGTAPKGSDCPADHPVKGNIRDRDPDKGAKIYHIPGGPSYADTKPERCFVDTKEAEQSGFRAPK